MKKRIIWIVAGALLLLGAIGLLWWWFLSREPAAPADTGSFGSSDNRPSSVTPTPSGGTNVGTPIPQPVGTIIGGTSNSAGGGSGGGSGGGITFGGGTSGASWLGGGGIFSPTSINAINSSNPTAPPPSSIGGGGGSSSESDLLRNIAAACSGPLVSALSGSITTAVFAVQVSAPVENTKIFMDCIARALARYALQQMTASIVNWVNSGFEGQPAFVQNYKKLFFDIADKAAGEFISGSALSFLCSPFQQPVKIAIAQSYARRNASTSSCTLNQALGSNPNAFLSGNFSQGGWSGLLSLTTNPNNNPYGAYIQAEQRLASAIFEAQQEVVRDLTYSGFRSMQEAYDCQPVGSGDYNPTTGEEIMVPKCQYRTTTPGSVIEQSLNTSLGTSYRQLELAKTFDETISSLISQLITQTLYGGFTNLSRGGGYGSGSAPLIAEAQALLTVLQEAVGITQQYGYTKQGSIRDIQNAQANLQTLANCWAGRGNSGNEQQALGKITELEGRVGALNADITRANSAIATLQDLQTRALAAKNTTEVSTISADFSAGQSNGTLITQALAAAAQQDRSTLQTEMSSLNADTSSKLNQCNAGV